MLVLRGSTMKNWRRSIKSAKGGAMQQQETDSKEGSQRIRHIPLDGNSVMNESTSSEGIDIICLEMLADVSHPEEIPDEAKYQMPFENNISGQTVNDRMIRVEQELTKQEIAISKLIEKFDLLEEMQSKGIKETHVRIESAMEQLTNEIKGQIQFAMKEFEDKMNESLIVDENISD